MMAKITKGGSFGGVVGYVMDDKKSANLIDSNGVRVRNLGAIIESFEMLAELTRKHRLYFADGKEKVKRHRLRGKDATKYKIYDCLARSVPLSSSWAELESRLRTDGIEVSYKNKGSTSQVEGVRFTADNTTFNGSKVDRQFSYSKIDFALRQNLRAEQKERQPNTSLPLRQEPTHEQSETIINGALGLFDFTDTTPDADTEEEALRRSVQKKKKPQRKIRF